MRGLPARPREDALGGGGGALPVTLHLSCPNSRRRRRRLRPPPPLGARLEVDVLRLPMPHRLRDEPRAPRPHGRPRPAPPLVSARPSWGEEGRARGPSRRGPRGPVGGTTKIIMRKTMWKGEWKWVAGRAARSCYLRSGNLAGRKVSSPSRTRSTRFTRASTGASVSLLET